MKKAIEAGAVNLLLILAAVVGVIIFIIVAAYAPIKREKEQALYPKPKSEAAQKQTGSGVLSGAHYNLNIIGIPKDKNAFLGDAGHRIFTPLEGTCKINLSEGNFQVIDGNCTDGPAGFQLPNPDPDHDGLSQYSVYARALGQPGGKSTTTTCVTDPTTQEQYCSVYSMVLVREKGKSAFTNVSKVLLYVYADINGDGTLERYSLFDEALKDYFWQYDNNGLKLAQLRFYSVSTNVN